MYRWHELGCRRPDVVVAGSTPYCNYCSALSPSESSSGNTAEKLLPIPQLRSQISGFHPIASDSSNARSTWPNPPLEDRPVKKSRIQADENAQVRSDSSISPELAFSDEFRVLRLQPGSPNDPIHAQLEVVDLRNPQSPSYEALSYSWTDESGDYKKNCPIFIGPYWDIIYTMNNCHEALKATRTRQDNRLIWVDSICITHNDVNEKSHQISLVTKIYKNAAKVIIYLGSSSEDSDEALDFLRTTIARSFNYLVEPSHRPQKALKLLFQRRYFSRLWSILETLYARRLEVVCGQQQSIRWSNTLSGSDLSDILVPTWFYDRNSWEDCRDLHPLLHLIIQTTSYNCFDPRDKVFAILALFDNNFSADYKLDVESVYTRFAGYLLQTLSVFGIFMLVANYPKAFNLPSWVPDWSQNLRLLAPEELSFFEEEEDSLLAKEGLTIVIPLTFDVVAETTQLVRLSGENKRELQLHASKVCSIEGKVIRDGNETRIIMDRKELGAVIISLPDPNYEIGTDFVFLFAAWKYPVIVRYGSDVDSFSFIATCAMSYADPLISGTWLIPWKNNLMSPNWPENITIPNFLSQDLVAMTDFYSRLQEILSHSHRAAPVDSAVDESTRQKVRVLDIISLLQTGLGEYERKLRSTWNDLERKLRWMFLDKSAIREFLGSLDLSNQEDQSGETSMDLNMSQESSIKKYFGVNPPSTCNWDLRRFCYSFMRSPLSTPTLREDEWTPVFKKMQENASDIRRWAEVTEQLISIFQFTHEVLTRTWDFFPGSHLPKTWTSHWQASGHPDASSSQENEALPAGPGCLWSWPEFVEALESREQLWSSGTPRLLNPLINDRVAAHIGARALGLNVLHQTLIRIQ